MSAAHGHICSANNASVFDQTESITCGFIAKASTIMSMLFMYSENGCIFYSFLSFGYLFQKNVV